MKKYQIKAGFTLAEVLVTLGIIGVVSAMTIPTLMQNYQRQSYVTQLHKTYNELTQANLSFLTEKNALSMQEADFLSNPAAFIKNHFKIVKDCGDDYDTCFAAKYKNISGVESAIESAFFQPTNFSCAMIANGSSICIGDSKSIDETVADDTPGANEMNFGGVGRAIIDINGPKGPNIVGRDLFPYVSINNDGSVTPCKEYLGITGNEVKPEKITKLQTGCKVGTIGYCFGAVYYNNWQMGY